MPRDEQPSSTTPTKDCDTCVSNRVCRHVENVKAVQSIAKELSFSCKFYCSPGKLDSLGKCDICGKPAEKLYECQGCHKHVCPECADITEMLDVNTGGATEEVYCPDCAKEEW